MWRLQIVDTHFTSPIQLQIFFDKYILNSIDTFPLAHWSLYEIIDRSPFCVYHFPFWSIVTHSYLRIIFHSKSQLYIFVCTRFYKYDSVWLYQTFSSPFALGVAAHWGCLPESAEVWVAELSELFCGQRNIGSYPPVSSNRAGKSTMEV